MARSLPCPECGAQNEPDGSGSTVCSRCGRFYRESPVMPAATRNGLHEVEAQLSSLDIPYKRLSDSVVEVTREIGPQTVQLVIDAGRTISLTAASGVANLSAFEPAAARLHFDPQWKERYDFDMAIEDKTFALMGTAPASNGS